GAVENRRLINVAAHLPADEKIAVGGGVVEEVLPPPQHPLAITGGEKSPQRALPDGGDQFHELRLAWPANLKVEGLAWHRPLQLIETLRRRCQRLARIAAVVIELGLEVAADAKKRNLVVGGQPCLPGRAAGIHGFDDDLAILHGEFRSEFRIEPPFSEAPGIDRLI